jgi:methyl-accepting chemotaxis protein
MSTITLPRTAGVRNALTAIVGVFTLLMFGALLSRAYEAWDGYSEARKAQEFDAGANLYISATFEILRERLLTNNALQDNAPVSAAMRQEIETLRANVRRGSDAGLAVFETKEFAGKAEKVRELRTALATANAIRQRADAAIQLPKAQRDEALLRDYAPVITALVNAALGVWYPTLYESANFDALLFRFAVIKELGWRLRDVAGIERGTISGAIAAGTPLTEAQLAANASVRARVNQLWNQLENLVADADVPPTIRDAMTGARQGYFGDFQRLAEEMRKAGDETGRYPMSAAQYVDTTTPQLYRLFEVMLAGGKASEAHTAEIVGKATRMLMILIGMLLVVAAIAACAVYVVVARILRPLGALAGTVEAMAGGALELEVPGLARNDELGTMAAAIEVFRKNGLEARRLQAAAAEEQDKKEERQSKIDAYLRDFEDIATKAVGNVAAAATQMRGTAGEMVGIADDTSTRSTAVAAASEEASSNVQTVAAAAEEMNASIGEITRQVQNANTKAQEAAREADATDRQVQGLAEAAQRIGEVVKIISSIAAQTNLLALNATIEAARAGDAGKGFAVVASEVKSLANQTAKATDEIAQQVSGIQSETGKAVTAIRSIAKAIADMNAVSSSIASAVEEQSASTQEISRNVQQAAAGTQDVSSNVGGVTQAVNATRTAADRVREAAETVTGQAQALRGDVESFLAKIRAA